MDEVKLLAANEIQDRLLHLPGWSSDGRSIIKSFNFTTYMEGVAFANRVADTAELANHHPDIIARIGLDTMQLMSPSRRKCASSS